MNLTLISVPYDSALRGVRMGAGPEHLLAAGLPDRFAALGHTVQAELAEHEAEPPAEIRTGFELMRGVAICVRTAVRTGRLPVILSGNCNTAMGTLGGLGGGVGVVWFDAHGDFNTPETTTGGFLDGTGLATVVGRCWQALAATVPGFHPVPENDILLVGTRDLDPAERAALDASDVTVLSPSAVRSGAAFQLWLDDMAGRVNGVYLHLDLDVLDPFFGCANTYSAPGGLSPAEVRVAVAEVGRRLPVRAFTIASYDPAADTAGTISEAALDIAEAVVGSADGAV